MTASNRMDLARSTYEAYQKGDRRMVEDLLSEDFIFYSPADVGIDRERYFE
jgi:ketosteroid isomerase-like protein